MEEDNLHVTEDIIQSLVRGIVGELFVPDNRPRQDQQFGATGACRELELITGNVDAQKQCKCLLLLPRLRVVFAGRFYIHPLEEAGKNIFQEIFVLFRRGFRTLLAVLIHYYRVLRPQDHVVSLVQGKIFVASHIV
jgi:hypothetical protein